MLALTFADPDDYERILVDDTLDIVGARRSSRPDVPSRSGCTTPAAATSDIVCQHTMSEEHIGWFRAGSALNVLRAQPH